MSDETNPTFLFQSTDTSLLLRIVQGDIDPTEVAALELSQRGLNHGGTWVGFQESAEICRDFLNPES